MEKYDIGCKDLVPVPLTCQRTSIKHMEDDRPVCHDAFPDHQSTSTIVVLFNNVKRLILTTGFSPDENTSRVNVLTESRLITEETPPLIIRCPHKTGVLSNMVGGLLTDSQSKRRMTQGAWQTGHLR
ncbi:hypothetical protein TNCV_2064491 [Trichonephila clavipes]|nr:hypothetical protein TNCV_2064491 [Trichonephila clavipes]